jgi:hypothetical protein
VEDVKDFLDHLPQGAVICTWRADPCLHCVISVMSMFNVHLLIYPEQQQQLELPEARS